MPWCRTCLQIVAFGVEGGRRVKTVNVDVVYALRDIFFLEVGGMTYNWLCLHWLYISILFQTQKSHL